MKIEEFKKSECWIKKGNKFSIEIKHWIVIYCSQK